MKTRSLLPERLDVEDPPRELVQGAYRFLRFINRWLGGARATHLALREFSARWKPGETIRVLDVAGGAGDMARLLAEREPRLRITIVDLRSGDLRGDALRLPFRDGAFDYVISSLFLHHLSDEQAVRALRECDRVARRGMIMNDLIRRRRLYLWTRFFTLFGNEIVRYDGPLSVLKAFTVEELRRLAAPLPYLRTRACFGHRVLLYGERD